jgi:hypothetical protein
VNLLDNPGRDDFSEDTYRTLTAVDSALNVVRAAAMLFSAKASGQVFHRCADAEAKVTFSDRGCPSTPKPSTVEVEPKVLDSAPLRQAIRDREAEERRCGAASLAASGISRSRSVFCYATGR